MVSVGDLPVRMAGDRKYKKDKEIISEYDSHTKGKFMWTTFFFARDEILLSLLFEYGFVQFALDLDLILHFLH